MASDEIGISSHIDSTVDTFEFSEADMAEVQTHLAKYPDKKSAVMPVLWMAQNKYGWLSSGALELVADTLELSYAHVYGVATFYTQYYKQPVPKYVFDVCTCFTCGELGGDDCLDTAKSYTNCDAKGFSEDGLFYFRTAECLGSCDTGPVAQITNRHYIHNVTPDSIKKVIDDLRADKGLSYHQIPLKDQSKI